MAVYADGLENNAERALISVWSCFVFCNYCYNNQFSVLKNCNHSTSVVLHVRTIKSFTDTRLKIRHKLNLERSCDGSITIRSSCSAFLSPAFFSSSLSFSIFVRVQYSFTPLYLSSWFVAGPFTCCNLLYIVQLSVYCAMTVACIAISVSSSYRA